MSDIRVKCGKHVGAPCPREAVELLLVRMPGGTGWEARPRCDKHPAAGDIPLLGRVISGVEYAVVPLPGDLRVGVA